MVARPSRRRRCRSWSGRACPASGRSQPCTSWAASGGRPTWRPHGRR